MVDEAYDEAVELLDLVVADGRLDVGQTDAAVVGQEDVSAAGYNGIEAKHELGVLIDTAGWRTRE